MRTRVCVAAILAGGLLLSASSVSAQQPEPQVSPEPQPPAASNSATLPEVVVDTAADQQPKKPKKKSGSDTASAAATAGAAPAKPSDASGTTESAYGPVDGYVATSSATATKTGTPLIEIPQSVSVVTADQIEAQQATSFTQVLYYVPGVSAEPFGFESRYTWIKIRGFDATREGLYADGLQYRNPDYVTSYSFEPYGAERIEILKGPSSEMYGAGSPGGIINYVSKRPTDKSFSEIEVLGGSDDFKQGNFDFGGRVDEAGTLLFRMTGVVRDADTQQNFVQNDRLYLAPSFTLRPDANTTWTVLAHYQDDDTNVSQAVPAIGDTANIYPGIAPSFFAGEPGIDFYERNEYAVTSLFEHVFNETWTFRQNAHYVSSRLDLASAYLTGIQADNRTLERAYYERNNELDQYNIDNHAVAKFNTAAIHHTALFGLDYQHLDARDIGAWGTVGTLDAYKPAYGTAVTFGGYYSNKDIEQSQTGLYAQDQIKFTRNWILTLGGRYDWAESKVYSYLSDTEAVRRDEAFSGRAGLVYKTDFGVAPYISYSESFLPVTESDASGILAPETGKQYEVGVKYQPPGTKILLTAALFDLTRQNFVEYNDSTFLYDQTGEANSRGVELSASASLAEGLDLLASFTTFDIEITESRDPNQIGKDPLQTADTTASLWADYTFQYGALQGFGLGGGMRYIGSSYADTYNNIKVPDVTLFDATVHYDFDNVRLAVNATNLFDKEYAAGCFVRSSTLCTYGTTRNVVGSLKVHW